jgi:hypothetical protein
MMKSSVMATFLAAVTLGSAAHSQVAYTATDISGNTWQYSYTLTNGLVPGNIGELTVFFSVGLYSNLASPASPGNWSPIVVQPDASLPQDGFYDVQALDAGLAPGQSVSEFTVDFTWLGTGTPGSQLFNIVNPVDYSTQYAGNTTLAGPPTQSAPEIDAASAAAALTLLCGGLVLLNSRRGDRRGRPATAFVAQS